MGGHIPLPGAGGDVLPVPSTSPPISEGAVFPPELMPCNVLNWLINPHEILKACSKLYFTNEEQGERIEEESLH